MYILPPKYGFPLTNFPTRVSCPEGNSSLLDYGRHICHTGFDIDFLIIEQLIYRGTPRFKDLVIPTRISLSSSPRL